MTDEADRSDDKIAAAIANGIDRARKATTLVYTGECHFCGEELADPMRFCDSFCRDDWDLMQKAKKIRGG